MNNEISKGIPILMYHDILKDEENTNKGNPCIISLEHFQSHIEILCKNNFHTITLCEMEKYLNGKINLPERSVLITFDDGCKGCYRYAYPLFRKYSYNAVVFLVTGRVTGEDTSSGSKSNAYLNWREINQIRDNFEFASHTNYLHTLDSNNKSFLIVKPKDIIMKDLKVSKDILNTQYFAYPFGQFSSETKEILMDVGFTMAFTTENGYAKPGDDLFEIKRIGISPGNSSAQKFMDIIRVNK